MWMMLAMTVLAADDFVVRGTSDGVEIASREVPGSSFVELRFRLDVDGDLEAMCAAAWGTRTLDPKEPYLVARQVVRERPNERVVYDQISPPVVSKRDYVVRRTITHLAGGACRVDFELASDLGPPSPPGWVRLKRLTGVVEFSPTREGRVHVEHRIHTDPGGDLPAWIVESSRRDQGVAWLRKVVSRG